VSAALRQRRSRAAAALAEHPRRAQLGWDDLAAWPSWADAACEAPGTGISPALPLRVGALWHAGALRRCIVGATLKRVQQNLGDGVMQAVLASADDGADTATLPAPEHIESWLQAQGAEVMLAALPSPLLRLALRERLWPQVLPQVPTPDAQRALRTLNAAQTLAAAGAPA
jgi:hypothetical protein